MTIFQRLKTSWTLYFNVLSALLIGAETQFHLLKGQIGDEYYNVAYFTLILVNIALRFRTEIKHVKQVKANEQT